MGERRSAEAGLIGDRTGEHSPGCASHAAYCVCDLCRLTTNSECLRHHFVDTNRTRRMSSLGTSAVKESANAQFPLLEQQLRLLNANKVRSWDMMSYHCTHALHAHRTSG